MKRPGAERACVMSAATLVKGELARTNKTAATSQTRLTGTRSFCGSKPRFGCKAGRIATEELVKRNVLPSGGACTTACAPIAPPAPERFSTMKLTPKSPLSR